MSKFVWNHPLNKEEETAGSLADVYSKGEIDAKLSDNADFLKSQVIDFPTTYRSGHSWTDESNALYGCIYIQAEPNTTYYVTISNIKGSVRIFTKSAIASSAFGTYVDYQNNVSIQTDSTNTMLCVQFNVSSGTVTEQDLINANVQVSTSVIAMSNVDITKELSDMEKNNFERVTLIENVMYQAPTDGYMYIVGNSGVGRAYIYGGNANTAIDCAISANNGEYNSVFIRKGMYIKRGSNCQYAFFTKLV